MLTWSKAGIHKPRVLTATLLDDADIKLFEPTTFKQVVKHDHWQQAMATDFSAFQ